MARVPQSTTTIQSKAAPTVYQNASGATADAFGAAQGRALQAGGQQLAQSADLLGKRALEMQIEDNERELKDWQIKLKDEKLKFGYGDGTAQNPGFYGLSGQDAVDAYKDGLSTLDKRRKELEGEIKNQRVQQAFSQWAQGEIANESTTMSRYVAGQRKVALDVTDAALLEKAAQEIALNPMGSQAASLRADIVQTTLNMADRKGIKDQTARNSMVLSNLTSAHSGAIKRLLEQDPAAAKSYYDKHLADISPLARADLEKSLDAGTLRQQSQEATDRIMASGLDEKTAMAEARKIKDPKLRDETAARLQRRFAENDRIKADARREAKSAAWQHVLGGGSVDDIAPATLANMDGTAISVMKTFEKKRAADGRGFADATDPATYNMLHGMAIDNPVEFAKYDISQHIGELDEPTYKYWLSQQRSVDKAAEKDKARAASYSLADRMSKEYLKAAGVNPNKKGASAEKAQKVLEMTRQIVDTMHDDGKKATREDIEKGLKQLFLSGDLGGVDILSPDRPFFEVAGTDDEGKFVLRNIAEQKQDIAKVTGVPVSEIEAIAEALVAAKKPVTPANIQRAWSDFNGR